MRSGVVALFVAVVVSALTVVWAKYESRSLFVSLQGLQALRDDMNVEWGRLRLEESTAATHGRIERVAREQLRMRIPDPGNVVILRR